MLPHQRDRTWAWVLAETGIVVAGILIAFALNSWWEGRSALAQEQAHLQALRADFRQNVEQLEGLAEYQEDLSRTSLQLLLVARGEDPRPVEEVEQLLNQVLSSQRFDAVMGAYEGLVMSGGLAQLRDDSLRSALAGFAAALDLRYPEEFSTAHYLRLYGEFSGRLGHADRLLADHRRARGDGVAQPAAAAWIEPLLNDPVFQEHLALRHLTERDVARTYLDLADRARAVLDRVEALIR